MTASGLRGLGRPGRDVPVPLRLAAALVGVEGLTFLVLAVLEIADFEAPKALLAVSTAVFFALYGVGLAVCAWAALHRHSWARAPIVLAQLIQLFLAWDFWGGETSWVSVTLVIVGVGVLVGILHPASIRALADEV